MNESVERVRVPPVLEAEDLHKTYPGGAHATKEVPLTTNKGECLGVVDESGSGEPTLARCLLASEPAPAGRATLEGEPLLRRRGKGLCDICRRLRVMFQNPTSSFNSWLTTCNFLLEPLHARGFVFPSFAQPGTQRKVAEQLIDPVCLSASCLDHRPHELSGGRKQRAAITRAISVELTLLIFGKPTTSFDVPIQTRVLNLLQELREELGLSSMFISHGLSTAQFMSERSIILCGGETVDRFDRDEPLEDGHDRYTEDLIKLFED